MMTNFPVTLTVPSHIYERAKQIANRSERSIEDVLVNLLESTLTLPSLPANEQRELDALASLSDDALWTIAREQMTAPKQQRMQELMDGNNKGILTFSEKSELANLVEDGHRLMLRKAQAVVLLKERGHDVSPDQLMTNNA